LFNSSWRQITNWSPIIGAEEVAVILHWSFCGENSRHNSKSDENNKVEIHLKIFSTSLDDSENKTG
jgi:hypothetical protein